MSPPELLSLIERARPSPVSPELRAVVLEAFPDFREVPDLDSALRQKLASAASLFEACRRDGVYVVKVVDLPTAAIAIYGRTVIVISLPALKLLAPDELQAAIAHEIGHEYLWSEYVAALETRDRKRLREVELVCDALATLTLIKLSKNPEPLLTATAKLLRFNQERFGEPVNEGNFPTIRQRRALVRQLSKALHAREED